MENKFLNEFNSIFGTQLKQNKQEYTMLMQLYHDFIEQSYKTNELYDSIMSKIVEIEDQLQENLTEEGKQLFQKWETYRNELSNYEAEQSFIYRFLFRQAINTRETK